MGRGVSGIDAFDSEPLKNARHVHLKLTRRQNGRVEHAGLHKERHSIFSRKDIYPKKRIERKKRERKGQSVNLQTSR